MKIEWDFCGSQRLQRPPTADRLLKYRKDIDVNLMKNEQKKMHLEKKNSQSVL